MHTSGKNPPYVDEFTISEIKPNEILVKTDYSSINPLDVKLHAFTLRNKVFHTLRDFSGTVVEVGEQARSKFAVGDSVYGTVHHPTERKFVGSYTIADLNDLVGKLPSELTTKEGAALGIAYGTAAQLVDTSNSYKPLGPESKVLLLGGGTTVGSYAIEILKKVYKVGFVAVTSSPGSAEHAKEYGADEVINYKVPSLRAELKQFVQRHGFKFDTILDTVGGYDAIAVYPDILKPISEHSSYLTVQGDAQPSPVYNEMLLRYVKGLPTTIFRHLFGKYLGINYKFVMYNDPKGFELAHTLFAIPGVKVPIDSVYPADDIKAAWHKVDSTRARGKVLIKFN